MNIDEFKILWQAESAVFQRVDIGEIRRMTKSKATDALSQFSRNILLDIGFLLMFLLVGFVAVLFTQNVLIDWIVLISAIVFIPFFYMFLQRYFYIKNIKLQSESLYNVLNGVIENLSQYTTIYFRAAMILTLIVGPLGVAIGFFNEEMNNPFVQMVQNYPASFLLALSCGLVVIIVGNYFFTRWYLKKLYGNYIEELKACLDELDDLVQLQ